MKHLLPVLFASLLCTACDIQPVAVGEWQVEIESGNDSIQEVWTLQDNGNLAISGADYSMQTLVEMAGSRLSWSLDDEDSAGAAARNFSGTVSGNRLQGTLYSQQGNQTVSGTRL